MRKLTPAVILLLAASARGATTNLVEPRSPESLAEPAATLPRPGKPDLRWSLNGGPKGGRGASQLGVSVGTGIKEGPRLQAALWGAGGAVAGSFGGPAGAAIGGAAGALAGLIYSKLNAGGEKPRP